VSRLIGAPPGYVGFDQGGLLTDGVDQHPHCASEQHFVGERLLDVLLDHPRHRPGVGAVDYNASGQNSE
jgi:hypothetical protein